FAHAAKQGSYSGSTSNTKLAWLNRASQVAQSAPAKKYSAHLLRDAIPKLRECLEYIDELVNVSITLAEAGVRLVIIEHLPGLKMDGSCFWIDESSPVIALSLRFDRVDNFWFVLFHEIDHVLHGEGRDEPIYELVDFNNDDLPPNEIRAN